MKFGTYYSSEWEDGSCDTAPKNLLTFLGYTGEVEKDSRTTRSGGETTLTYKGDGTYTVGKNPTYYNTKYRHRFVYSVSGEFTARQEKLMDELYEQIHTKYTAVLDSKTFAPLSAPYLPVSVKEYYEDFSWFPGEKEAKIGLWIGAGLGIFWPLFTTFAIVFLPFTSVIYDWFARHGIQDDALFYGVAFAIFLTCLLIGAIWQGVARLICGKRTSYDQLSQEKKEHYRQAYMDCIEKRYKGEAGVILQNIAIERGYDKI